MPSLIKLTSALLSSGELGELIVRVSCEQQRIWGVGLQTLYLALLPTLTP